MISKANDNHPSSTTDIRLTADAVRDLAAEAFANVDLDGKRVLIIIPDSTRTAPIPMMFRLFHQLLGERVKALDYLVALGTHPIMSEDALNKLVGVTAEERAERYPGTHIFNHRWDLSETFANIGTIPHTEIETITHGMLSRDVNITINRRIFDYDQLIICGPVFPHEVVGFSGGTKYFFPGIAGPEVINFTHWLGALMTSMDVIGNADTPVRDVIDRATSFIDVPRIFCNMVVTHGGLMGLFIGDYKDAWLQAVALSSQLHIRYVTHPYQRVLSVMPEMYDDIWTAAKGMYKMEPVIADGGEVVIYAPHIDEVSYTHGHILDEIGYHVRDYFVKQWEHFKDYPWGVLAHSTHLRGVGTYDVESGEEHPRIKVTLATKIPKERCERINLGYMDPATVNVEDWKSCKDKGTLVVPRAGEILYKLRT
jgi:nickel-dependent lactate racemase